MSTKTLILAAAAVLSLGVGSAFAEGDGSGLNDYRAPRVTQPVHQVTGQSAGDAAAQSPNWIQNNATGGGN